MLATTRKQPPGTRAPKFCLKHSNKRAEPYCNGRDTHANSVCSGLSASLNGEPATVCSATRGGVTPWGRETYPDTSKSQRWFHRDSSTLAQMLRVRVTAAS